MKPKYWLGAAAGALGLSLVAVSASAAPMSAAGTDARAAIGDVSSVQNVYWGRRYHGGYYYAPRRYRSYGYYRPYRYYGYGPGFGFYAGPRYGRGWW